MNGDLASVRESDGGSPFAGLAICAAAGFDLPPGVTGPLFDQDVWDFHEVNGLPTYIQPSTRRMRFTAIVNPRWRTVAKEYIVALLAPGHERVRELPHAHRHPLTLATCSLNLDEVTRWLNWLTTRGLSSLGQVRGYHCDAYTAERARARSEDGTVVAEQRSARIRAVSAVIGLARYRELFTADRYPADLRPFNGRSTHAVVGGRLVGENSTPVVPAEVLQPMLAAALYLVETLAPHILDLQHRMSCERSRAQRLPRPRSPDLAVLRRLLERHMADSRPLPRRSEWEISKQLAAGRARPGDPLLAVNQSALAREAGLGFFHAHWLASLRPDIEKALRAVGVEEPHGREATAVGRADGAGEVPWTLPLRDKQATDLGSYLRTACILVIAAVSGMRASELHELAAGCRLRPRETTPGLLRYRLAGTVIKGQPLGGKPDEWVVTSQPYTAAGIAEQLLGDARPGTPLFGRFSFGLVYEKLRVWVNGLAGQRLGLAPIPAGHVNLRMLRRTLAVELAYRPGGLLAAKIQLKHVSVVTTEGYAARPGGAQARLLAEVGEYEQERNLDLVLAEYRNYQDGVMPAGPGARDLVEFFAGVDGDLAALAGPDPNTVDSDQQVRTLLAKRAGVLHLGVANYCWFIDPSRALCLKLASTPDADKPLAGLCDSARCPQATHHPCHRPVWAETANNTTVFIGNLGRGQKTERARLHATVARAERVIAEIDAATAGEPARRAGMDS